MTEFARWMAETGTRDDALAAKIRKNPSTIWRIRNGRRMPSAKIIEALVRESIEMVAKGEAGRPLRPDDFFEIEHPATAAAGEAA